MIPRDEERELFTKDGPSLEKLSHALKHRELWPDNFHWDFGNCRACAMGLAAQLFNFDDPDWVNTHTMSKKFNLPKEVSCDIFLGVDDYDAEERQYAYGVNPDTDAYTITPEMVADKIDEYLKGSQRCCGTRVKILI